MSKPLALRSLLAIAAAGVALTLSADFAAAGQRGWYGPGSGPSPYPQTRSTVAPRMAAPARTTIAAPGGQPCVAGSRCFNGFVDGHRPQGFAAREARPAPRRCVPGVGLVGLDGLCVR